MSLTSRIPAGKPAAGSLAIQWVFPRTKVTVIDARAVLGRSKSCTVVLRGQEVSRRHALVTPDGDALALEDLGSRNGSCVSGRRVARARLGLGAVLRLGDWVGLVRRAADLMPDEIEFDELGPGLFGSGCLRRAVRALEAVATGDGPVVLEGETGTGKKLAARALHRWSARPGRFIVMNCAAVPDSLVESELFGGPYDESSDTTRQRAGRLRAAHRGTLMLENVACLSLETQARLAESLRRGQVCQSGSSTRPPVHARVVVASHESLDAAAAEGRLHSGLRTFLGEARVLIPPLRARIEDVPALFLRFVRELSLGDGPDVDPRMIEQLSLYDWPYNVQELRTLAQGLLSIYGHRSALTRSILPARIVEHVGPAAGRPSLHKVASPHRPSLESGTLPIDRDLQASERELTLLVDALRFCHGDLARACSIVGISHTDGKRLLDQATVLTAKPAKGNPRA